VIVLGVDPGKTTGLAVLEFKGTRVSYVEHATATDPIAVVLCDMFDRGDLADGKLDLVAVEIAERANNRARFGPSMATGLLQANEAGNELLLALVRAGYTGATAKVTAANWRRFLCRRGSASDARIAAAVTRTVRGWPARSNEHARDAAGVAMYGRSVWAMSCTGNREART